MFLLDAVVVASSTNDRTPWPVWVIIAVIAVAGATASSWQFVAQWWKGVRGRDWPTVPATIDFASVQQRVESTGKTEIVMWVALLTYVYRNPDLQTGDFDKSFYDQDGATAWANSLKGRTVMVHVDPRDPANSVLRTEDLESVQGPAFGVMR